MGLIEMCELEITFPAEPARFPDEVGLFHHIVIV